MADAGKRIGAMRKIAKLYGAVERMHSVTLRQASSAVDEAEKALGIERGMDAAARVAGRQALGTGQREEWMFAEAQREMAGWRRTQLESLREERVTVREAAKVEFLESRVRTEQIKQVVLTLEEQKALEETRRTQAVADDRYLMRLRWSKGRV